MGPFDPQSEGVLKILFLPAYSEPKQVTSHRQTNSKPFHNTKPNFLKFTLPSGTHIQIEASHHRSADQEQEELDILLDSRMRNKIQLVSPQLQIPSHSPSKALSERSVTPKHTSVLPTPLNKNLLEGKFAVLDEFMGFVANRSSRDANER